MRRVLIVSCVCLAFLSYGCASAEFQADVAKAQTALVQAQQIASQAQAAATALQAEITQQQVIIAQQKAVLATQPSDPSANKALEIAETAMVNSQTELTKTNSVLNTAAPIIKQLSDGLTAIQNGQNPNFSGLGAFGPYGAIAGIALSLGWGVFSQINKNKVAGQLAAVQPAVDHLQDVTGTDNPTAAVAVASHAVAFKRDTQSLASKMSSPGVL